MTDFIAAEGHEVTAFVAYTLWEKRGRSIGSPEVDRFAAKNQLAAALAKNETVIPIFELAREADEGPRPAQCKYLGAETKPPTPCESRCCQPGDIMFSGPASLSRPRIEWA